MGLSQLKHALTLSENPTVRRLRWSYRTLRSFSLPAPHLLTRPALWLYILTRSAYYFVMRVFICEPLFKAYCTRYGRGVTTGVFIHWVQGNGDLSVGNRVMMDGKSSIIFAARYAGNPTLTIGDHTFVGHNTTFVVGKSIYIGRHCLLSTDVCLRDCDGHPVSPDDRAAGLSAPADEVRGITIGDNVWIGMRAIILKGVTIGDNSIVGAGAVVTRDVPANAVVAGNPAKLVRHLDYCEYAVSQMPVTLETATNGAP